MTRCRGRPIEGVPRRKPIGYRKETMAVVYMDAMSDQQSNRAAFLQQAAACMEVADRMSLLDDRIHMLRMAQRLMEQAGESMATEPAEPQMIRNAG